MALYHTMVKRQRMPLCDTIIAVRVRFRKMAGRTRTKLILLYHTMVYRMRHTENQMIPSTKRLFRGRLWYNKFQFQEDNDPKHTSHLCRDFLKDMQVDRMEWPAQSPDLNPIENLWSILDRKAKERKSQND
jgi:hypothetical protein